MISSIENIKNSKSRFIRISSEDKSTGTNNKFTVDLQSVGGVIDNIKGFIVHSIECPNVFNNITLSNNNYTVVFTGSEENLNISVPPGYYLIDDLLTIINTQISNQILFNGDTYTMVLSKIGIYPNEKILVTINGITGIASLTISENSIWSNLGIETSSTLPFDVFNSIPRIAQNIPNLIGETAVYVHSRVLCANNLSEGSGSFSVVDKLNLDKPYGSICYSNFNNDTTHMKNYYPFETKQTLRIIDINLRNRVGDLLELPSNFYFTMMIKIFS